MLVNGLHFIIHCWCTYSLLWLIVNEEDGSNHINLLLHFIKACYSHQIATFFFFIKFCIFLTKDHKDNVILIVKLLYFFWRMSVEFGNVKCEFLLGLRGPFGFTHGKVTQVLWQPQPICKPRIVVSTNIFIDFGFSTWLRYLVICRVLLVIRLFL